MKRVKNNAFQVLLMMFKILIFVMYYSFRVLIMKTWKPIITMDHIGFDKEISNLKKQRELRKN